MDGQSSTPPKIRQTGVVIRILQATVSLEDRLTAKEAHMTRVLRILWDQGVAISVMAASLIDEPPERQQPYPRLHERDSQQGFMSAKRQRAEFWSSTRVEAHWS
ncbi:hypothetical protein Sjap_016944 [Stephania japonica]|uniref:Uncharacterized protein n=1 Tax=Stephania japonica TaxID=461633 RepID=A0AAP0I584_9MAGN